MKQVCLGVRVCMVLRKPFSAGSSGTAAVRAAGWALWGRRGKRPAIADPLHNKGHRDLQPSRVTGHRDMAWPVDPRPSPTDCEGKKSSVRGPPWRHQLEMFLCSCAGNKLLYRTRHLRFCNGKPRAEPVRKPSLTGCEGVWREPSQAPARSLEPPTAKGPLSCQWKSLGMQMWLPDSPKGSDREVSLTMAE